jgi:hypothetical protein
MNEPPSSLFANASTRAHRLPTAPEPASVIVFFDADGTATIRTHRRRIVAGPERNPRARHVAELSYGSTVGACFDVPFRAVPFTARGRNGSQRHGNVADLRNHGIHVVNPDAEAV